MNNFMTSKSDKIRNKFGEKAIQYGEEEVTEVEKNIIFKVKFAAFVKSIFATNTFCVMLICYEHFQPRPKDSLLLNGAALSDSSRF